MIAWLVFKFKYIHLNFLLIPLSLMETSIFSFNFLLHRNKTACDKKFPAMELKHFLFIWLNKKKELSKKSLFLFCCFKLWKILYKILRKTTTKKNLHRIFYSKNLKNLKYKQQQLGAFWILLNCQLYVAKYS